MKQLSILAALLVCATSIAAQTAPHPLDALETKPESTNFQETSRYQEVVDFMEAVAKAANEKVLLTTFGETNEKRALPLAVIGAPAATPEAVRQTGKIRVYIQGNIHGGEVEGKESAQMLIREFAQGKHEDWLKTMVFLIAPIYNADGNERFALNNRGPQHGPMGGQGQRPNAQGLDLNRDHMKLDSPVIEAADARQIIGTKLGLRSQLAKGPEVEILMGETIQEKHPVDGHTMELRTDARKPERMAEYGTFEATETERVPSTYYVPADLTKAIDHLRAHGVRTTTLSSPTKVMVEEFQITGNSVAARAFETHTERTLTGQWVAAERELPAGTVVVNIKQPLGRLAFYLVEPRSDDGLVDWNIMDAALGEGVKVFPIVRSRN